MKPSTCGCSKTLARVSKSILMIIEWNFVNGRLLELGNTEI